MLKTILIFFLFVVAIVIVVGIVAYLFFRPVPSQMTACLDKFTQETNDQLSRIYSKVDTTEQSCVKGKKTFEDLSACELQVAKENNLPSQLMYLFNLNKFKDLQNRGCRNYPSTQLP